MITRNNIPNEVTAVAKALEDAGFEAYLVGGCVRDLLLGLAPKDWDYTTNATPDQIEGLFPETFCNNDFGTVGVVNEDIADGPTKVIEVTPYRTESGYSDARRPDTVEFGVSLEEDLARRDFTVNAIAYRVQTEDLVDRYDSIKDIKDKRLKAVGDPKARFEEDALRIMRAVRLAVQLDFVIDGETMAAIVETGAQLQRISVERIRDEFLKTLMTPAPMQGIVFFEKLGLLPYIMPELLDMIGVEQGGIHAFDVYEHLLRTMQHAADKDFSVELRLAALLHDIGKPASRRTGGRTKKYTFFGHEVIGARMAKAIMKRFRMPKETSDIVEKLVRWHMFFSDPDEISLSAVRRTITNVGEDHIMDLLNLRRCDRIGTGRPKEQPFRFRKYKAMVDEALRDPISVKMLKINGDRIMELTGERPSRKLGDALHALLEEVLEDPAKNTEEYLEERVHALLAMSEAELTELAKAGKVKQAEEEAAAMKAIEQKHQVG